MREDSRHYLQSECMHFHNGGTCHGRPTLQDCLDRAVARRWEGRVLERTDTYSDGAEVKCYSLISSAFEHWSKHGKYVAEISYEPKIQEIK